MAAGNQQRMVLEAVAEADNGSIVAISIERLIKVTALPRAKASRAARELIAKGLLMRRSIGNYGVTTAGKAALKVPGCITNPTRAPRHKVKVIAATSPRQMAWTAMRIRRTFTMGDLITDIEDDGEPPCDRNLRAYISKLLASGFIIERGRTPGTLPSSPGFKTYLLVRDSGFIAPTIIKKGCVVFDHNSGKEYPA